MRQTIKAKHEQHLNELKKAVNEFIDLTESLTLFRSVNANGQEIARAVKSIDQVMQQGLAANKLIKAINDTEAARMLDEIVDADVVSELEVSLLSVTEEIDNEEVSRFFTEMIDKVERKYNQVLEKAHAYNALLKEKANQ